MIGKRLFRISVAVGTVLMMSAVNLRAESPETNAVSAVEANTNQIAPAAGGITTNAPFELKTLSGQQYVHCRITRIEPSGITLFHSKGIAKVLFSDLNEDWQKLFDYDADKAEEYEAKVSKKIHDQMKANAEKAKQLEDDSKTATTETTVSTPVVMPPKVTTTTMPSKLLSSKKTSDTSKDALGKTKAKTTHHTLGGETTTTQPAPF